MPSKSILTAMKMAAKSFSRCTSAALLSRPRMTIARDPLFSSAMRPPLTRTPSVPQDSPPATINSPQLPFSTVLTTRFKALSSRSRLPPINPSSLFANPILPGPLHSTSTATPLRLAPSIALSSTYSRRLTSAPSFSVRPTKLVAVLLRLQVLCSTSTPNPGS